MKRTIEQWKNCSPSVMAREQSDTAIEFAFEDAKADILELYKEVMRLRGELNNMPTYPNKWYPYDVPMIAPPLVIT